jgi:hypothetical protein
LLIAALVVAGGVAVSVLPRGIRNKNPGNLRRTGDKWLGLAATQTDPEYFQFATLEHGLRAMGRVLLNYYERHNLRTVAAIVARYAPEHENPTDAYIANVARALNVRPGDPIDVRARLPELMRAMVIQENGSTAERLHVPPAVYDGALALLGLRVT